jgi:hypothetical protein
MTHAPALLLNDQTVTLSNALHREHIGEVVLCRITEVIV